MYSGSISVSFICILSCVASDGGPDILLTTDSGWIVFMLSSSVLAHSLWPSLQASDPWPFGLQVLHRGRVNNKRTQTDLIENWKYRNL